jgi:hypothetical protein
VGPSAHHSGRGSQRVLEVGTKEDGCIPHFPYPLLVLDPAWLQMLYKLTDLVFTIPVGSPLWPLNMHEPLFVSITLPFIRCRPWSLRGMLLLVELAGRLQEMLKSGPTNGGIVLCKLLRTLSRLASMSDVLARQVLQVYGDRDVSNEDALRRSKESVVQTETEGR